MTVPVLTAVTGAAWEEELVRAFDGGAHGVRVVRRCVDLADLLATAATGTARAALLSADLRRLDRDALARLTGAGVAVVGLAADPAAQERLRRLGVVHLLDARVPPEEVGAAVVAAVARAAPPPAPGESGDGGAPGSGSGRIVAVWGPAGAPGRTSVAVNLAAEVAAAGRRALLVDADPYGGTVAQALGLLDEAPGLAAAARQANAGRLETEGLAQLARTVRPGLAVLTGITRADRWPELRGPAVEEVLELARGLADVVVVDCGFCLEQDDTDRNAATLAALTTAADTIAVGSADPVSLARLVRGLAELGALVPDPQVVVNRLRPSGPGRSEIDAALERYAGTQVAAYVPLDVQGFDAAMRRGATLAEAAPKSPARTALAGPAGQLAAAH